MNSKFDNYFMTGALIFAFGSLFVVMGAFAWGLLLLEESMDRSQEIKDAEKTIHLTFQGNYTLPETTQQFEVSVMDK